MSTPYHYSSEFCFLQRKMQERTNITNLSDVIPIMESIPCPDCGNPVIISPHPNSHYIAGMDDCLYHGQCKNIPCQTCSKKKNYVKLMDTAKKITYHPAKNVGNTVFTG